jgi:hypothetical protein
MTKIMEMLARQSPMPIGEFRAEAMRLVPCEATRYGKRTRLSVVKAFLRTYRARITQADGMISATGKAAPKDNRQAFARLKETGKLTREESGYRPSAWSKYSQALRDLNWITIPNSGSWVWCGPEDALWVTLRETYKQKYGRKKKDAKEC